MRPPKPSAVTPDEVCRRHVEALARSGQRVADYARKHGIKYDTLYRWRRRFRPSPEAAHAATPRPAPVPTPRLVPISVEVSPACEVVFPDG